VAINVNYLACNPEREGNQCAHTNLEQVKDYLGYPEYFLVYNSQRFDNRFYQVEDFISNQAFIRT